MPDIPKILITTDAVGGIWTYALDLGRALAQGGYAIHLATVGPGLDETRRKAALDAGLVVTDLGHAPEWLARDAAELAQAGEALAALARREAVDLIHLNHPALAADVRFEPPVVAICHSCTATWWKAVKTTALPDTMAWQKDAVARGYKAAGLLVAPSRAFAEATRSAYDLGAMPEVVHNGRAPVRDAPPDAAVETVFTSGRLWDEGKNIALLDRVAALTTAPFRAAGPVEAPYGGGPELRYLDLLGSLSEAEIRAVLAERPVYVSAARYEPFGLAVLEAAQAGCALVLSDIPTFRELWDDAALFVDPDDAEAFAAAVGRLLSDETLRADMANAAENRARVFGLDAFVADMQGLYRTLVPGLADRAA
ncbi:glycosyltransferase family 4 protein [Lichenihabitans sp. Uapishka_5]|uniref:glycosyltransferase family 4 protein n=1 Tax=Lichenihabitans sp. Uapishka_5 TaxID=3037302 RepID=UPI0029E7E348|nr:glycosyltransferase family 4 protein [Lichenihabitans sp. Uapishka_5]MDX7952026.1 glycosyltransferase family 4 protein [Lichenihabitans sp. Uapishka_5]